MIARKTLLVFAALCICSGGVAAQEGASLAEFQEARSELKRKVESPSPEVRADACRQLARFNSKTATLLIIDALENAEKDLQTLYDDRAALYKRWEDVKVDWTVIEKNQGERVAKYRAAQAQFADHYEIFLKHLAAKADIIESLSKITDQVSIELLVKRLRTHTSNRAWVVRSIVTEAFAKVESPLTLEVLIFLANKETAGGAYDSRIAIRAIYSLGAQKDGTAERAVIDAARSSEDWQVRAAAIKVLGNNKVFLAKPVLEEIAKNPAKTVAGARLRADAVSALLKIDPRGSRELADELKDIAYPCLDLNGQSRNILFMISAGNTMAWDWDTAEKPQVEPGENRPRFELAREGVKDYLRTIVSDMEALEDPKKDFVPFRFNICIYRGYSDFWKPKMVSVDSISGIIHITDAIKWLDYDASAAERRAAGEANLVEALDKSFNLMGFGGEFDAANLSEQPDTILLISDITPNAGAFKVTGDEADFDVAAKTAWTKIQALVEAINSFREVQISTIAIGTESRSIVRYVKGLALRTGGNYSEYTPSSARAREMQREISRNRPEKSKGSGGGGADKGDADKGDADKSDADKGDADKGDADKGDADKGGDTNKGDDKSDDKGDDE